MGLTTIRVETVASLLRARGIKHLDFLKIDVEGFERRVLEGAAPLLAGHQILAIQFEYGLNWFRAEQSRDNGRATLQWTVNFLDAHGFDVYFGTPGSLLRLNDWHPIFELPIGLALNTNVFAFSRVWVQHPTMLASFNRADSHWLALAGRSSLRQQEIRTSGICPICSRASQKQPREWAH